MSTLSIVALVSGTLSIFMPMGGIFIAMLSSLMAMMAFRSQPTLATITFGINIINASFLSSNLATRETSFGDAYLLLIAFHVVFLLVGIVWRLSKQGFQKNTHRIL